MDEPKSFEQKVEEVIGRTAMQHPLQPTDGRCWCGRAKQTQGLRTCDQCFVAVYGQETLDKYHKVLWTTKPQWYEEMWKR